MYTVHSFCLPLLDAVLTSLLIFDHCVEDDFEVILTPRSGQSDAPILLPTLPVPPLPLPLPGARGWTLIEEEGKPGWCWPRNIFSEPPGATDDDDVIGGIGEVPNGGW